MGESSLHFGYEDGGPNCLIGSHGILFATVTQTPKHNALEYARKFAAVDDLIAACEEALAIVDECYAATGHFKVAKTSKQRLRIEAAILKAKGPTP